MTSSLRIGVVGCTGRMGLTLLHAIESSESLVLAGGVVMPGTSREAATLLAKQGLAEVPLSEDVASFAPRCDALIDFTTPANSVHVSQVAAGAGVALVTGTTGFLPDQRAAMIECAGRIPLVMSSNTSIGVTVFSALVEQAARLLDDAYDIEIVEMHHRHKKDAPSGTARLLGDAAASGRGVDLAEKGVTERDGVRERGDIGFASLRGGDVVGDHSVVFAGPGERFELTHRAGSRDIFAHGALKAVQWVVGQAPGIYSMRDVLGL